MYELGTIGGLFDNGPNMPIDPSWLPPGSQVGPDGKLTPAPPPPPSSPPFPSPVQALIVGVSVGIIAGYLQWGRSRR